MSAPPSTAGDGNHGYPVHAPPARSRKPVFVLINRHLKRRHGIAPFGEDFNVRTAPRNPEALLQLVIERCPKDSTIDGRRRDTVTSNRDQGGGTWLRGGSDRGFSLCFRPSANGAVNPIVWFWSTAVMGKWIAQTCQIQIFQGSPT